MKNRIILLFVIVVTVCTSCSKKYTELYSDNIPDIAVTYKGAITHGANPYITQLVSQEDITLTLQIPDGQGRSIKEITKVLAGATSINAGGVRDGKYIAIPIPGKANEVVFNTSISAFRSASTSNNKLVQDFINSSSATSLQIAFMFLVTLDNNQQIIPVQVQVWLTK